MQYQLLSVLYFPSFYPDNSFSVPGPNLVFHIAFGCHAALVSSNLIVLQFLLIFWDIKTFEGSWPVILQSVYFDQIEVVHYCEEYYRANNPVSVCTNLRARISITCCFYFSLLRSHWFITLFYIYLIILPLCTVQHAHHRKFNVRCLHAVHPLCPFHSALPALPPLATTTLFSVPMCLFLCFCLVCLVHLFCFLYST